MTHPKTAGTVAEGQCFTSDLALKPFRCIEHLHATRIPSSDMQRHTSMLRSCRQVARAVSHHHAARRAYASSATSHPTPPPTHQQPPNPAGQPAPLASNTQPMLHMQQPPLRQPSARERQAKNWPPSDAGVKYILLGSIIGMPALCWFYYEHRRKHMDELRHAQLKEVQDRYRRQGGTAI